MPENAVPENVMPRRVMPGGVMHDSVMHDSVMPGHARSADNALPPDDEYGEGWLDDDAGPVVPAYALTGGRTKPARTDLDLVAIVEVKMDSATRGLGSLSHYGLPVLGPEHEAILDLCRTPLSVAELASDLDLALGVVRILLGDLLDYGIIQVRQPASVAQFPNERVLKEVIDGLRAL